MEILKPKCSIPKIKTKEELMSILEIAEGFSKLQKKLPNLRNSEKKKIENYEQRLNLFIGLYKIS